MASAIRMIERIGDRGGSNVAKGAIGYGTARMLAKHCHGKKDAARVPYTIAAVGKLAPALIALFFGPVDGYAGLALGAADAAGQGAVDFLGVVHGLRDARKAKGLKAIAVPASAEVKGAIEGDLVGDGSVLGRLGAAQPGASLSLDKLREIQAYR